MGNTRGMAKEAEVPADGDAKTPRTDRGRRILCRSAVSVELSRPDILPDPDLGPASLALGLGRHHRAFDQPDRSGPWPDHGRCAV